MQARCIRSGKQSTCIHSNADHSTFPLTTTSKSFRRRNGQHQVLSIKSTTYFQHKNKLMNLKGASAYVEYNSSKEMENNASFDSKSREKGQVSTAFWYTKGTSSTSILNKTSIFQHSRSPKTRRCDSTEPSTPERGGQR